MKMKSIENPRLNWKEKILVSIQVRQKCSWNEKGSSCQLWGAVLVSGNSEFTWVQPNKPCSHLGVSQTHLMFSGHLEPVEPAQWLVVDTSLNSADGFDVTLQKPKIWWVLLGNFQWYAGCLLDRTTALLFLVIDIHRPKGRSYPIEHEQHLHQYAPGDPVGSSWYHKSHPSPRSCWWVFADCACCPETSCCKPFQPFMNDILLNPSRITQFLGASCWKGCHRGDTPRIHVLLELHSVDIN